VPSDLSIAMRCDRTTVIGHLSYISNQESISRSNMLGQLITIPAPVSAVRAIDLTFLNGEEAQDDGSRRRRGEAVSDDDTERRYCPKVP
jgi:hypothetical protein